MRSAASPSASSTGPAEAHLGEHALQLLAHRVGGLLRHGLEALHERETGAERAREQRQGVGQLVLELQQTLALAVTHVTERADRDDRRGDEPGDRTDDDREQQERHDRERGDVEEQLRRADRQVGPLEHVLDLGEQAGPVGPA